MEELLREVLKRLEALDDQVQVLCEREDGTLKRNFTLAEAAEYLSVPKGTLREHIRYGRITGSKPGRCWIFEKSALDAFVRRHRIVRRRTNQRRPKIMRQTSNE
jgi:excisionase family DNA binding protein